MWLDEFEQLIFEQSRGGTQTAEIARVVWHCTAGWCAEHAFNVYRDAPKGACPHITAEYAGTGGSGTTRYVVKRRFQHVPLSSSSYSLQRGDENHICNVQTNRAGVVQIERVGFPYDDVSNDEHRWLGEQVLAPILHACPAIPPSVFQGSHRMTELEWSQWPGGQCGHRNVCCQPDGHGDPPELDLDLIQHYALEHNLELEQPKGTDLIRLIVTDDPAGAQLTLGVGTLAWLSSPVVTPIFDQARTPTVNVTVAQVHELLTSHRGIGAAPTWGALQGAW